MAYVPDYIRPVGPKSPPAIPTRPTNSNHVRRISSVTGSTKSSTSNGRERSNSHLPEGITGVSSSSQRRSSSSPVCTSSRFLKPSQDRLCSRVSIQDRLKSLESDASVKLELRHIAQRPKRCSTGYRLSHPLQTNTSSDKDRQSEDNSSISSVSSSIRSNKEPIEKIGEGSFAMPKPDIIASNQPKNSTGMQLSSQKNSSRTPKTYEQKDSNKPQTASEKTNRATKQIEENGTKSELNDVPKLAVVLSDNDNKFSATKNGFTNRKMENRSTNRRTSEPITPYCNSRDKVLEKTKLKLVSQSASDASSADEKPKLKKRTKSSENLGAFDSNAKEKKPSGSGFKPIWRTPSFKQAEKTKKDRLSAYVDEPETSGKVADKHTSMEHQENKATPLPKVSPSLDKVQKPSGAAQNLTETKTTSSNEKGGSASVTEPTTIASNATTTQAVANETSYPVELRSPRHEHSGQAFRRQGTKDKRNARFFIMPSSSDSDLDNNNQLTRMERDFAKLGLSRAVDLLPDSYKITSSEDTNYHHTGSQKTPELTIKHVTPVKFVPNVLKANNKDAKDEKKDTTPDQSSKIYPELLTPYRGPRRDSKTRDGDSKKDSQKSPNRRRRTTRSSRSGANRSKSTDARRARHDVQRNRSNSMCDPKRMRHGQEAVANAVISGHHPGSAIPYIDDISSPVEEVAANNQHPKARRMSATTDQRAWDIGTIHRSNSADVLSYVVPEVSPAKLRRARASSVDRSAAKGVHRRSYQIATMAKESDPEHRKKVEKLKKFLLDADRNGDGSRDLSLDNQDVMTRSGNLHFKVSTIDKGKRTSSQKSWKLVWATLKDQQLCLTKDLSKSKNIQDSPIERQLSAQDEVQSLNVQSSLVGIAYNYLKRRNVFKLTTFNGSEYLFQAENRNDMLSWIDVIQKQSSVWEDGTEGISEDLIMRKTSQLETGPKSDKRSARKRSPKPSQKNNLQVKDVDGSRRFKWRGSVTKIVKKFGTGQPFVLNGTFGVHLEDCPTSVSNEFVPFIVELCCRIVEERGLHFTGIYRVPGNNASLSALQEDLNNRGAESIQPDDERLRELNVVSSLMKSFFRKLPEPLFTNELYHDFIQANRKPTPESRLNGLRKLVHMLPGPHYETLKYLIFHLRLVADNCDLNKMEVRNLAIVFGPTLVRNTATDNTTTMVTDMSDQCRIIESIIDQAEWFFSDTCDPAPETSRTTVPVEKEHEAVPSIEFLLDNVGRKPGDTGTTESGKSKGSDDSENSFSRDLMDLLFGKKWKQSTNPNSQVAVGDNDDGGFGEYHAKKQDGTVAKNEESVPEAIISESAEVPQTTQLQAMPNVSERLMNFYREHLERLSQTTIGQTLPTFSSADSSPRTTPRHSTVFNAPLVFPPQDNTPRVGNRSRVSSDSQDLRYIPSLSYEVPPKLPPLSVPEIVSRSLSVPQYKYPPNPYHPNVDSHNPKPSVSDAPPLPLPAVTRSKPNLIPEVHKAISKTSTREPPNSTFQEHNKSTKSSSRKPSHSDNLPYANDHVKGYQQIEPIVTTKAVPVDEIIDGNHPPADELPKPEYITSPNSTRSRKLFNTSPDPSASLPLARSHSKKASAETIGAFSEPSRQKCRQSMLKENFNVPVITIGTKSDNRFSRCDPKRRGIRFAGSENDQLSLHQNASTSSSPKQQQLTATERLFNVQPLRRKPSSRENRLNKVIRRHTLSGIQDLEDCSPSLRFKSNLQQAGQNLSMYDLATDSTNGQRSAMERLNPKGATSGMTLGNWMVQERLRNITVQGNGSTSSSVRRRKEVKEQFRSYV